MVRGTGRIVSGRFGEVNEADDSEKWNTGMDERNIRTMNKALRQEMEIGRVVVMMVVMKNSVQIMTCTTRMFSASYFGTGSKSGCVSSVRK